MTSGFYKYAQLIKLNTNYAKRMERLSSRIFGNPVRPTKEADVNNIVGELSKKPVDIRDEVVNWYPRHRETHKLAMALRDYGLFRDEHEDFKEEMIRQRAKGKDQEKTWRWIEESKSYWLIKYELYQSSVSASGFSH